MKASARTLSIEFEVRVYTITEGERPSRESPGYGNYPDCWDIVFAGTGISAPATIQTMYHAEFLQTAMEIAKDWET